MSLSTKNSTDIIGRINIALKVIWGISVLVFAVNEFDEFSHILSILVAFTTPVWGHEGIKWLLGRKIMPFWGMFIFGFIYLGALIPIFVADKYTYDFKGYLPTLIFLSFGMFYLFRFLQNLSQRHNSFIEDFRCIGRYGSILTFLSIAVAIMLVLLSLIAGESGHKSSYNSKKANQFLDEVYGQTDPAEQLNQSMAAVSGNSPEKATAEKWKNDVPSSKENNIDAMVSSLLSGDFLSFAALLVFSAGFTWAIGLLPSAIARYVVFKRPIEKGQATWISGISCSIIAMTFIILNAQSGIKANSGVWVLVFFVARWIMTRGNQRSNDISV